MNPEDLNRAQRRAGVRALKRAQRHAYAEGMEIETWTCGWPRCREVIYIGGTQEKAQKVALEHYRTKHGGEQP